MKLTALGAAGDLRTVVILGAGASRGSSCARQFGVSPPVDSDFFVQAQRLPATDLTRRDRDLFTFVGTEYGWAQPPSLEVFFTQISAIDRFHHEFNIQGRVSKKFDQNLRTLRTLIPRVFEHALGGRDCRWHERVASSLRTGDALLSFNYDTLMDRALRSVGGKRWSPKSGYGFEIASGADSWSPPRGPGPMVLQPILLLKPHGSLNWHVDASHHLVNLVDEYTLISADSIVPPTWDKAAVGQWPWNDVWRSARRVLAAARMIIFIGYSVPLTDQLSQALLRADANKLRALVVANPDAHARRRVIDLMAPAVEKSAIIVELDTFEEFARYLPASVGERHPTNVPAELERMRDQLQRAMTRVGELERSNRELDERYDELEDNVSDLRSELAEVNGTSPADLDHDVRRLRDEVRDLEQRIDSMMR